MKEELTITIIGCGARGKETYGRYANNQSKRMRIVALCDKDETKLRDAQKEFAISEDMIFKSSDELFKLGKVSDAIIIASYDQEHYKDTIKAIELGYDILLEKPISNNLLECLNIKEQARLHNTAITVCHVMRYTSYYQYLKKLLDEKTIGDIVAIEQTEDVAYWHMAHAFVRGNFRSQKTTSPMILQKCCHDMDLILYLTDAKPASVYSVGDLRYFKKENAFPNAKKMCYQCSVDKCIFNAQNFYLNLYHDKCINNLPTNVWPLSQVCTNPNEERLLEALKTSKFGRCVFHCDNDVVDHQFTTIKFENGIIGILTMIGFSNDGGRQTHVYGTSGEIYLDEQRRTIEVSRFGHIKEVINFDDLSDDFSGHGGGDNLMMKQFEESLLNKNEITLSSIEKSVDSHLLCFASEASRINNGKIINLKQFEMEVKNEKD